MKPHMVVRFQCLRKREVDRDREFRNGSVCCKNLHGVEKMRGIGSYDLLGTSRSSVTEIH